MYGNNIRPVDEIPKKHIIYYIMYVCMSFFYHSFYVSQEIISSMVTFKKWQIAINN